ncbi:MAG: cytochrome c oxidase subunit II [Jaaginema sp. PMC 1079.18]|nr:cytochrome c oxidase subunit II [Jaaginema sp. PMC 1080.18]MEC4850932.1 cytochrome c oxidase subunit II [Jaaginema sp. PMC 1079.18]MEC4865742.1 cytochrome c oxidase subunit II [Jaaginema sp. PMC 1078.18]
MAKEKETVPGSLIALTIGLVVAAISVWYGQNNNLLPEQVSEQAPLVDDLFTVMATIAMALFLIVEGAIVYALIRFRHKPGDETDGDPVEGNFPLEIFWTAIPAFLVIGLGIYSVEVYNQMGGFDTSGQDQMAHHHHHSVEIASLPGSDISAPLIGQADVEEMIKNTPKSRPDYGLGATPQDMNNPAEVVVNVTGLQYAWLFNYPGDDITSGELHVPAGKDVQLNISAQDVIHSFWLPQFRIKQDALPGQMAQLRFTATHTGTYPIVCAELCGAYHGAMRSQIIVHEADEYEQWLEDNRVAVGTEQPTVAVNPQNLSDSDYLQPYAEEMGINADVLAQIQP